MTTIPMAVAAHPRAASMAARLAAVPRMAAAPRTVVVAHPIPSPAAIPDAVLVAAILAGRRP